MISRIYCSNNETLFLALEEIFLKFKNDYFLKDFDFIIFAISPTFNKYDINPTINRIFKTKNYLAFNAINAFANKEINNGVTALFIKFENKGKINIKLNKNLKELENDKLHMIFMPYKENECVCQRVKESNLPLIGGVCSGDEANVYIDSRIEEEKPVILEFENVEFEFGISLGYRPIGPTYKVNLATENKVYVVDFEDTSLLAKKLLKNTNGDIRNLWYSPLLVISDKDGMVDVVRTFKDIKENHYVEFFGYIEKNSLIKLSFATNNMLLEEDEKTAKNIKEKILQPEVIFNFSCVAREYILGEKRKKEAEIYSKILNAPVFGFFTYGEIGPDYEFKTSKLYNQSSLVVAMKEK